MADKRAFTILVTGSRDAVPEHAVPITEMLMETAEGEGYPVTLIHGDARGVDRLASIAARTLGWHVIAVPAEWGKYGKGAGHQRNLKMLSIGRPDVVLAFPLEGAHNRGTKDCMMQARMMKVPIIETLLEQV